jgi:hypothetical protein
MRIVTKRAKKRPRAVMGENLHRSGVSGVIVGATFSTFE